MATQKMGPEDRQVLMDKIVAFAGIADPEDWQVLMAKIAAFTRTAVLGKR